MIPSRKIYFGNENRMEWIKAPAINTGMSRRKWNAGDVLLNGGAYELSSVYSHLRYELAWNLMSSEEVRQITAYHDGVWGNGLLYYLDPFSMENNVLPLSWSVPSLAGYDAPPLVVDSPPTTSATPANVLSLPAESATYTIPAGAVFSKIFVPVPDGEVFDFGAVGSATGTARVVVTPKSGAPVSPALLSTSATDLSNLTLSNTGGGVTLSLQGQGTITLRAMVGRISPEGSQVTRFVPGGGTSGLRFSAAPSVLGYSAPQALDLMSVNISLTEVGAWEPL